MPKTGITFFDGSEVAPGSAMKKGASVYPEGFGSDAIALIVRGIRTRITFLDEYDGEDGFSLVAVDVAPRAIAVRHHHDSDCLYLLTSGEVTMGSRIVAKGGGFFVRADSPYTYQGGPNGATMVEFRTTTKYSSSIVETNPARQKAALDNARANLAEWDAHFNFKPSELSETVI